MSLLKVCYREVGFCATRMSQLVFFLQYNYAGGVSHFVYILQTPKGTFYTGYTTDLERRFKAHQNKKGAKYTKAFGAKKLLYSECFADKSSAMKREAAIKKLSRSQKASLCHNFKGQFDFVMNGLIS